MKILILDFLSEKNRGDAATQSGLVKLVYQYFRDSNVSIVSNFGANQIKHVYQEYDHSLKFPVTILGGLRPTFYPLGEENRSVFAIEILNALSFIAGLLILLLVSKLPVFFVSRILPAEFRKTLHAIHDADLIIWSRRNLRSRKSSILEVYRTLNTIYHPLLCIALSKPMACVGHSLWKLRSPLSKFLLKFVFQHCFFLSFREESSYLEAVELLRPVDEEHFRLLPDLSFAGLDGLENIIAHRRKSSNGELPKIVGMTLVDWTQDGRGVRNAYTKAMSEAIQYFVKRQSQVVIVPQVTKKWEDFRKLWKEIYSEFNLHEKENIILIEGEPGVEELLKVYSQLDFLIATRMHSGIFALAVQTPIVAISYDAGGKWGVLKGLGYADYIIPYSAIRSSALIDLVRQSWQSRGDLLEISREKLAENFRDVSLNVSLISERWQSMGVQNRPKR